MIRCSPSASSPWTRSSVGRAQTMCAASGGRFTGGPARATTRSKDRRPVSRNRPRAGTSWYPMCQTDFSRLTGSRGVDMQTHVTRRMGPREGVDLHPLGRVVSEARPGACAERYTFRPSARRTRAVRPSRKAASFPSRDPLGVRRQGDGCPWPSRKSPRAGPRARAPC